ncbi:MAG: DNA topoisomerase VI subunit B [Candidatus Marsarchaeota archaeon]|nr:DNA topoisomerase VI subunit B [Candidatus Marsarchaeota archaeon]MCL5112134.1 DNA topoisomerase VI subunit B [Candidatus Marsarchaeota archaeon]
MATRSADEIFKEFKEHSVAEFFKRNRQMLGYSGKVRSLVTAVHEYVTNSLDACEEAGILPSIYVKVEQTGEDRYRVIVGDNGPGIPQNFAGKALATILSGTKFNRYMQQRGQQGIGAAGCTMFAQITTGKPIHFKSGTGNGKAYECNISIDTLKNKPIVENMTPITEDFHGSEVAAEFGDVKYENSDKSVYEYLRRTALSNPHLELRFVDPTGAESTFVRATDQIPQKPKAAQPHPLGMTINDLLDMAKVSANNKISAFLTESFSRFSQNKLSEVKGIATGVDFDKAPKYMTWADAEAIIKAIKEVKWIAPDASFIIPIGKAQVEVAVKNILNPDFMSVVERKPQVFRGGVPFIVEAAVAFGGQAGRSSDDGQRGSLMRFANRVPLLYDAGSCAITEAVRNLQWKRYGLDMETQPVSVFVNVSSVYIPYSGVGKEAIAQEEEIMFEIRLAVMDALRGVQRYVSGRKQASHEMSRYKLIMRYTSQLASDLSDMSDKDKEAIEKNLRELVEMHYPKVRDTLNGKESDEGAEEDGEYTGNVEDSTGQEGS